MRTPLTVALVLTVAALVAVTLFSVRSQQRSRAEIAEMEASLATSHEQYAAAFRDVAEIQDSLTALPLGNGPATLIASGAHSEQGLTNPDRQQALDRIAQVNATIARAKVRIHELETRLHKSGVQASGLQKLVANLKSDVATKEELVAQLTEQVNTLQTRVAGLETTVQQKQDSLSTTSNVLAASQHELGTVYYLIGSKQQLTKSGVIVARGGVLGLGKTVQLSGNFNESAAKPLDTDQETVIAAPASHVRVLSAQPASSYQLIPAGDHAELRILDAREFRKVRHVVIMTS
jgi:hypothetical protein